MSDFRTKIDEQQGAGVRFEVYQCVRKCHALAKPLIVPAAGRCGERDNDLDPFAASGQSATD